MKILDPSKVLLYQKLFVGCTSASSLFGRYFIKFGAGLQSAMKYFRGTLYKIKYTLISIKKIKHLNSTVFLIVYHTCSTNNYVNIFLYIINVIVCYFRQAQLVSFVVVCVKIISVLERIIQIRKPEWMFVLQSWLYNVLNSRTDFLY